MLWECFPEEITLEWTAWLYSVRREKIVVWRENAYQVAKTNSL